MNLTRIQHSLPDKVFNELPIIINYGINTRLRLAHFLSQCAHESGNFTQTVENLNYSVEGLLTTFPRYFKNRTIAAQYARQPQKIANRVYASRMGNLNEASGDGWRFRGRGYIQLTGRSNYTAFSRYVNDPNIITNPDLVATLYPLRSAAWFFITNNIHLIADKGSDIGTVTNVTRRINGGTNGLQDRINKFTNYFALLR